jgi:predicted ester cyclase
MTRSIAVTSRSSKSSTPPDYVGHIGARLSDRDGFKANLTRHRAAFPDWQSTVIARISERGTHRGAWKHPVMGHLDATNRFTKSTRIIIRWIEYGKVEESWLNADHLGMLQQVGAQPQAGAKT